MTTTFAEIERERTALLDEKERRAAETLDWMKKCDLRLKDLAERTSLLAEGVDLIRIDRARRILEVRGDATKPVHSSDYRRDDVRPNAVADARRWLSEGGGKLRDRFIGVKNYDRFGDQREDHSYGMWPRHGSIVFSIGLTKEARQSELTSEQIEDALYLLHVLPALSRAQAA